jgi:hypothetical protein
VAGPVLAACGIVESGSLLVVCVCECVFAALLSASAAPLRRRTAAAIARSSFSFGDVK